MSNIVGASVQQKNQQSGVTATFTITSISKALEYNVENERTGNMLLSISWKRVSTLASLQDARYIVGQVDNLFIPRTEIKPSTVTWSANTEYTGTALIRVPERFGTIPIYLRVVSPTYDNATDSDTYIFAHGLYTLTLSPYPAELPPPINLQINGSPTYTYSAYVETLYLSWSHATALPAGIAPRYYLYISDGVNSRHLATTTTANYTLPVKKLPVKNNTRIKITVAIVDDYNTTYGSAAAMIIFDLLPDSIKSVIPRVYNTLFRPWEFDIMYSEYRDRSAEHAVVSVLYEGQTYSELPLTQDQTTGYYVFDIQNYVTLELGKSVALQFKVKDDRGRVSETAQGIQFLPIHGMLVYKKVSGVLMPAAMYSYDNKAYNKFALIENGSPEEWSMQY